MTLYAIWDAARREGRLSDKFTSFASFRAWTEKNGYHADMEASGDISPKSCMAAIKKHNKNKTEVNDGLDK